MKLRVQSLQLALASGARGSLPLVGGASYQCWGVTAGKASQNASYARGVTAGKMGRNSSHNNIIKLRRTCLSCGNNAVLIMYPN